MPRPAHPTLCALAAPGQRWIEGVVPLLEAFPLHPNRLSMRNANRVIVAALKAPARAFL